MRSWTHSNGLAVASCGKRKPVQPPSRGASREQLGKGRLERRRQPERLAQLLDEQTFFGRTTSVAGDEGKTCCHTTRNVFVLLLFLFPRVRDDGVKAATPGELSLTTRAGAGGVAAAVGASSGGLPSISVRKVRISATTRLKRRPIDGKAHVVGVDLDRLVDFMGQAARGARRDDAVARAPKGQGRHRRLVADTARTAAR